jgi:ribose-phosphate pyrophosphokinase
VSGLTVLAGSAHPALAGAVAQRVGVAPGTVAAARFPDGEMHVAVRDSVRGHDVYLIQPTGPPCETHLLELLLLADACRRAGAGRLTAIVPYLGYARQDRRAGGREPLGARVIAELLATGRFERLVVVDLHSPALEGAFGIPVEHVTAVPALAEATREVPTNGVVVAPDLGAARLADRYARLFDLTTALVHKTRVSGVEVVARHVSGDVRGRSPVIVDDMISTGATIVAAVDALHAAGSERDVRVIATHALLVGGALERLAALPLRRLTVTDTLPAGAAAVEGNLPLHVVSVAPLLADVVCRLHQDRSLADLLVHG